MNKAEVKSLPMFSPLNIFTNIIANREQSQLREEETRLPEFLKTIMIIQACKSKLIVW